MALNDERQPWSGEVTATGNDDANIEHDSRLMENCLEENEDVIAR